MQRSYPAQGHKRFRLWGSPPHRHQHPHLSLCSLVPYTALGVDANGYPSIALGNELLCSWLRSPDFLFFNQHFLSEQKSPTVPSESKSIPHCSRRASSMQRFQKQASTSPRVCKEPPLKLARLRMLQTQWADIPVAVVPSELPIHAYLDLFTVLSMCKVTLPTPSQGQTAGFDVSEANSVGLGNPS